MSSATQSSVVVGVFEDRRHADQAISELRKAGFRQDQIGVAMRHTDGAADASTGTADADTDTHAESGALTGALTGLGLGALAGLGVLAGVIPIVGPAIAAGTLGVLLSNAAVGAGVVGLVGALVGAGVPEHEAEYYQGELEAGRAIVTVHADTRAAQATTILRQFGAYDMTSRGGVADATSGTSRAAVVSAPSTSAARATTGRSGDTIEVK